MTKGIKGARSHTQHQTLRQKEKEADRWVEERKQGGKSSEGARQRCPQTGPNSSHLRSCLFVGDAATLDWSGSRIMTKETRIGADAGKQQCLLPPKLSL